MGRFFGYLYPMVSYEIHPLHESIGAADLQKILLDQQYDKGSSNQLATPTFRN